MMGRAIMVERGSGEAAERARRRRFWTLIAGLGLAGFALGFGTSMVETRDPGGMFGEMPAGWALFAIAFFLVAVGYGSWRYFRLIDELEREDNRWAGFMAANALMIVYPVWYLLWRGGLVAEPSHEALFVGFWASVLAAYVYRKLR